MSIDQLRTFLRKIPNAMIAFSGGVDSTFLLYQCVDIIGKDSVTAVTVDHSMLLPGEADEAVALASRLGVMVEKVYLDPLSIPEVAENSPQRCYYCKKNIFSHLKELSVKREIHCLMDGTNADDASGYRPGMKALDELGVRSPLREAGLTKDQIRQASRSAGLPTWNRPSLPCLATRFPYGHQLTSDDLVRVGKGEGLLRQVGLGDFRLRVHGDVVRIELMPSDYELVLDAKKREKLVSDLKKLGYRYITLDLEGFRSGSMDEGID